MKLGLSLTPSRRVSTHAAGLGRALFEMHEGWPRLLASRAEDGPVDGALIRKTDLVVEGVAGTPYLHLDIRTPFGEEVHDHLVDKGLQESLGFKLESFRLNGWHSYFVEDTNLGSNHRVYACLLNGRPPEFQVPVADRRLPLELAILRLSEEVARRKGIPHFQFLFSVPRYVYSMLYLEGNPFHLLRMDHRPGPALAERLRGHREFAFNQGKNGSVSNGFKTFFCPGDPLGEPDSIRELGDLAPEPASFLVPESGEPGGPGPLAGHVRALHLGLALAGSHSGYLPHDLSDAGARRRNANLRRGSRLAKALGATALLCALAGGGQEWRLHQARAELAALQAAADRYRPQLAELNGLRARQAALEGSLRKLQPLWRRPMPWRDVFRALAAALPERSGIDGLAVSQREDGRLELSFRAWVKDWNQVKGIQEKLRASPHFLRVTLSDQQRDLRANVVEFHVTCQLEEP